MSYPRMMSAALAAEYSGGVDPDVFAALCPVQPISVLGSDPRWDRHALDQWLDSEAEKYRRAAGLRSSDCLARLLSHKLSIHSGDLTVGNLLWIETESANSSPPRPPRKRGPAARALRSAGLQIVDDHGVVCLAVANHHAGLRLAFAGTPWASGKWRDSLLNWPTARRSANKLNFHGQSSRAVLIEVGTLGLGVYDARSHNQDIGGGDANSY